MLSQSQISPRFVPLEEIHLCIHLCMRVLSVKIRFEDSGLEIVRSSAGGGEGESLSDGL